MTVTEAMDLGQRAIKCPKWVWLPGMMAARNGQGLRLVVQHEDGPYWLGVDDGNALRRVQVQGSAWIPDLSDAATRGCLARITEQEDPAEFLVTHLEGM